jgi:lysophospholipase L1-like esterase
MAEAEDDASTLVERFAEQLLAGENEEILEQCRRAELFRKVDHPGATVRVGVVGDSLTVQTLDLLTADTRYNWSVSAVCGARTDHFLGAAPLGDGVNLRPGLDSVLNDAPDVLLIALGSNEVLEEVFTNIPRNMGPGIDGILTATASAPCRAWVNVHTATRTDATTGPDARWRHYAPFFNEDLAAFAAPVWVPIIGWDYSVELGPPTRLLAIDGVHLTDDGQDERTRLLLDHIAALITRCTPPPAAVPPPSPAGPPQAAVTPAPSSPTSVAAR